MVSSTTTAKSLSQIRRVQGVPQYVSHQREEALQAPPLVQQIKHRPALRHDYVPVALGFDDSGDIVFSILDFGKQRHAICSPAVSTIERPDRCCRLIIVSRRRGPTEACSPLFLPLFLAVGYCHIYIPIPLPGCFHCEGWKLEFQCFLVEWWKWNLQAEDWRFRSGIYFPGLSGTPTFPLGGISGGIGVSVGIFSPAIFFDHQSNKNTEQWLGVFLLVLDERGCGFRGVFRNAWKRAIAHEHRGSASGRSADHPGKHATAGGRALCWHSPRNRRRGESTSWSLTSRRERSPELVSDNDPGFVTAGGPPGNSVLAPNFFLNESGQVAFEAVGANTTRSGIGVISFGSQTNSAWSESNSTCGTIISGRRPRIEENRCRWRCGAPNTSVKFSCVTLNSGPPSPLNSSGQLAFTGPSLFPLLLSCSCATLSILRQV